MQIVQQAGTLPFDRGTNSVSVDALLDFDPTEYDRRLGLLGIPLYSFTKEELADFGAMKNIDEARDKLREKNILQYFFPAPDHLVLGLADRGIHSSELIEQQISGAPQKGHPLGRHELVSPTTKLTHLLDALKERGFLVESDTTIELSPSGENLRMEIRSKPREGLISKLINNISLKFDLSDLFKK
jgi:hypothetical protein